MKSFNDTWHHSFANQARAQAVLEILNATYAPSTLEEKELFDEKQSTCMLFSNRKSSQTVEKGLSEITKTTTMLRKYDTR